MEILPDDPPPNMKRRKSCPNAQMEAHRASAAYAPAQGCHVALDAWCMANCPHASIEPLYARFDENARGDDPAWRCYGRSTLDAW